MVHLLLLPIIGVVSETCRCVSFEGGGSKGAYEAGVVDGLLTYGNPEDYTWDVVTGTSTGALNTSAFTQYPTG